MEPDHELFGLKEPTKSVGTSNGGTANGGPATVSAFPTATKRPSRLAGLTLISLVRLLVSLHVF